MRRGTLSLLFGVHQVLWHPWTVYRAWRALFGRPTWREVICIILHDWGYWGSPNMDGEEGERHPELGAKLAGKLLGPSYHDLVLLHSRHYAKHRGLQPSKLCWADKLSICYDPKWFYLLRARLTGEIAEYRQISSHLLPLTASHSAWFDWMRSLMADLGHQQRADAQPYAQIFPNTPESR